MLVFRSIALGLLGACCLLFASHPLVALYVVHERPASAASSSTATIIDVAAGFDPANVPALVHLSPDEHVVAVNDVPVHGDLDAGAALAAGPLLGGHYADLDVQGPGGARRVLVLLH
jgi:hypothetical protein